MRFYSSSRFWALVILGPFALMYLAAAIISAITPVYGDHAEPMVVIAAQQWIHGRPIYHAIDAPYLYSMFYGPFDFLWLAGVLKMCPDPIMASKLSGGFWALAFVVMSLFVFRRLGGMTIAIAGVGVIASELLPVWLVPFWDRPDPILIFSVALGLGALAVRDRRFGAVILAIAIALAIDCKIHGFLYLIPALAVWWKRHGPLNCAVVAGLAAALSFIPFLLPNVSLKNYLTWINLATHHPLRKAILINNVEAFLLLLVPLALFAGQLQAKVDRREMKEESIMFAALLLAGLVVCIPAAKDGAGPHHLLPLAVYVGYLFCVGLVNTPVRLQLNWAMGIVAIWMLFSYLQVGNTWWYINRLQHGPDRMIQADLRQLLTKYPATQMQMGVGGDKTYDVTFYAPWIYREGAPRVLEISSYMDMKLLGMDPTPLIVSLGKGEFRYWLIPAGDSPFTMDSYYDEKPLFAAKVGEIFAQQYEKIDSTTYFDVYQARSVAP